MAETTDELLARMAQKYGLSSAPQQQPQQPAPQPIAEPPKRSLIDSLRGRTQQIDQAVDKATRGYKRGGKICAMAHGGKIEGPGTPTSDSIPAEVRESGEPIKVSTGERIISAAQDGYLAKLAKKMGFDSLDAMLEAGTGQPVGPTVKDGQRAAAYGMGPEDPDKERMTQAYRQANADLGQALTTDRPVSVTQASASGPWRNPNARSSGDALMAALTDNGKFGNFGGSGASAPTQPNPDGVLPGGMSQAPGVPSYLGNGIGAQPLSSFADRLAERQAQRDAVYVKPPANPLTAGATGAAIGGGAGGGAPGRSVMDIYKNASDIQNQQIERPTSGGIIRDTSSDDRRAFDNFTARTKLGSAIDSAITKNTTRSLATIPGLAAAQTQLAGQIPAEELARDALDQQGDIKRTELGQDARYKGAKIGVEQDEAKANGILANYAGLEQQDKAATNALTRDVSKFDLGQKQQMAELTKKAMSGDQQALAQLTALNRANRGTEDKVLIAPTATTDAQGVTTKGYDVVDARTGQKIGSNGGQQGPTIPQGAIDMLKKDPKLAANFDAKYGPGASSNYLR